MVHLGKTTPRLIEEFNVQIVTSPLPHEIGIYCNS